MLTAFAYRIDTDSIAIFAKFVLLATGVITVFIAALVFAPVALVACSAACAVLWAVALSVVTAFAAFIVALVAFIAQGVVVCALVASPMLIIRIQKELDR